MRLGLAVAAWIAACGVATAAPPTPGGPLGFDHVMHDRDVVVAGGESPPCAHCHAMRGGALVGRPGHGACFGACHGPAPKRPEGPGDRMKLCTSCHAEAALAPGARATVPYPPYHLERDFAIALGHRRHQAIACAQCHSGRALSAGSGGHARCAGCHDGSGGTGRGPAMTACTGCHTPAVGSPLPPRLVRAEVNAAGAFSHPRHAARGGDGARCTTCHRAVLASDDNLMPAPTAQTCAGARCHDGAAAFPLTAACTRCHVDPDPPGFKVERPLDRYSHAVHSGVGSTGEDPRPAPRDSLSLVDKPCATCHPLSRTGEVTVVGHAPCAPCHAEDFGRRQPTICGACHNGTEPWRALVADRGPPERTEFGATLDHARHRTACTSCHALTTATAQLRPPRGHRACTGKACHAVTAGPAPRLGDCEACHRRDRALDRQRARSAAPWSVRATFDHRTHAGRAPDCTTCHVDLGGGDVVALATPPKSTCAPCHDGTIAFKLTGTTCTRCHRGAP